MSLKTSLAFLLLILLCDNAVAEKVADPNFVSEAPTVVVAAIQVRDTTPQETYAARVEAIDRVDLVARVSGYLERRNFTEGQIVKKGDLLFVIEKAPYKRVVDQRQAEIASAQATLRWAKVDLKRKRKLTERKVASASAYDQAVAAEATARANLQKAEALLRQAQLNLDYTNVYAPIRGRIGRSIFSVGSLVDPAVGKLATIVSLDPIYVVTQISEKRILQMRRKGGVSVEGHLALALGLNLSDDQKYPIAGRFNFLDIEVDTNTDGIAVRGTFPNPDHILVPGQYVSLAIRPTKTETALVAPQASILKDQKGAFLLVVTPENVVEVRRVKLGAQMNVEWIVKDGVSSGETVIVHGVQKVKPGMTVIPVDQK